MVQAGWVWSLISWRTSFLKCLIKMGLSPSGFLGYRDEDGCLKVGVNSFQWEWVSGLKYSSSIAHALNITKGDSAPAVILMFLCFLMLLMNDGSRFYRCLCWVQNKHKKHQAYLVMWPQKWWGVCLHLKPAIIEVDCYIPALHVEVSMQYASLTPSFNVVCPPCWLTERGLSLVGVLILPQHSGFLLEMIFLSAGNKKCFSSPGLDIKNIWAALSIDLECMWALSFIGAAIGPFLLCSVGSIHQV